MFVLFNFLFGKKEEKHQPLGGPYRMPAEMPAPIHDPPQPKPKRQFKLNFKMPSIKLTKTATVFTFLVPVCLCIIAIGMLHDTTRLGEGLKFGCQLSMGLIGLAFAIKAGDVTFSN